VVHEQQYGQQNSFHPRGNGHYHGQEYECMKIHQMVEPDPFEEIEYSQDFALTIALPLMA
jgi:hypothetical protein